MNNKAVAIIPARIGSKRIPKKNIKDFFGKPLIAYSIETAIKSNLFDEVIVSTDSDEIAEVSKSYGAKVPFLRPDDLSDDHTTAFDVMDYMIKYFEKSNKNYKYVCMIYPTSPLLQIQYLVKGYKELKNSDAINAFSSTMMPFPVQRTFKITKNNRCEMFMPEHYTTRSQDLDEYYQDAGQFYWRHIEREKKSKTTMVFSEISIPIILPRYLVQDIDVLEDWKQAEIMYQAVNNYEKYTK